MKTRTKSVKRTNVPRTARKAEEPFDPRLKRTLAELEAAWHDEKRDPWGYATALWEVVGRHLLDLDGLKRAITVLVEAQTRDLDRSAALDEMAAIADEDHRAHCACCAARHVAEAVK